MKVLPAARIRQLDHASHRQQTGADLGFDVLSEFHHPGDLRLRRDPNGGNPTRRNESRGSLLGLSRSK